MALYCFHYDEAKFDLWLDLWTEHPVWDIDGKVVRGRQEVLRHATMVEMVDGRPPLKHYIANEVISVSGNTASSKCYLLVARKQPDGALVSSSAGYYEDKLVKQHGRWLFAERVVRRDLRFAGVP